MDLKQVNANIKEFMQPGLDGFCYIQLKNGNSRILAHTILDMPPKSTIWSFSKSKPSLSSDKINVFESTSDYHELWRKEFSFSSIDEAISCLLKGLADEEINNGHFMPRGKMLESKNLVSGKEII